MGITSGGAVITIGAGAVIAAVEAPAIVVVGGGAAIGYGVGKGVDYVKKEIFGH